ncbi:MAG: VirB3 family type IV secretion system protein [Fusobacterium sp.]|nr:VirB3 family type IV secretion system protein [Fusobacterium sp.]
MNEDELFYLPIYNAFTKPILFAGLPFEMAILIIGGMLMGIFVFNSLLLSLFFLAVYFVLFLVVKFSPKFDVNILKIVLKMSLKKYINY